MSDHPLRTALLRGRRRPRRSGAGSPTLARGDGYEFVEVRDYIAGDDPRRIDWASTARAGALQTRVILEDVALTLGAILDNSGSMRVGRRSSLLSAGLDSLHAWYGAAAPDDRCLRIDSDGMFSPPDLRGQRAGEACSQWQTSDSFSLLRALNVARAVLPRGAALLVVADAYDLAQDDTLLSDIGSRFDATMLLARDPWHDALPLRGFHRIADAETGQSRTLYFGATQRAAFATAAQARDGALTERFDRAGWRVGSLRESRGTASLYEAFGVPFSHAEIAEAR